MKRSILITLICILAVSTAIVIICYQRSHAEEPTAAQPKEQVDASTEPAEPTVIDEPSEIAEPAKPAAEPAKQPAAQTQQPAPAEEPVFTSDYIDLGLPSHTRWRGITEDCGLITYEDAVALYKNKLPNKNQLIELRDHCEWTITEQGYKVTGPNGNYIILPCAGLRENSRGDESAYAQTPCYWTRSLNTEDSQCAWAFEVGDVESYNVYRSFGMSVRPVRKQ